MVRASKSTHIFKYVTHRNARVGAIKCMTILPHIFIVDLCFQDGFEYNNIFKGDSIHIIYIYIQHMRSG